MKVTTQIEPLSIPEYVDGHKRVLDDFNRRVFIDGAKMLEERIRLVLRPRPKWLPEWAWRKLTRLLVVEIHKR